MHTTPKFLHKTPRTRSVEARFCGGGFYSANRGCDYPRHQHTHWEFVYYLAGNIRATVGDEEFHVQPGMALLTPPHTPHSETAVTDYRNIYLFIEANAKTAWPKQVFDDIEYSMGHVCKSLVAEWSSVATRREEMLELLFRQLLICIERSAHEKSLSNGERVVRFAERVREERSAQSLSIAGVAREVGVSPSYLRKQFLACRQKTPRQHLQEARLRHALRLLQHSSLTLENIAQTCGYHSASHLSRHVKSATGRAPGTHRVLDL